MATLNWKLMLVTFTSIPVVTVISKYYGRYYQKLAKAVQKSFADANEVAEKNEKLTDAANVKLAEQIKRSGGCWLWLLLLGVLINFVAMVIFMKTVKLGY